MRAFDGKRGAGRELLVAEVRSSERGGELVVEALPVLVLGLAASVARLTIGNDWPELVLVPLAGALEVVLAVPELVAGALTVVPVFGTFGTRALSVVGGESN